MNIARFFEEYPITVGGFIKINNVLNTALLLSKNDIKGFKITECSGEVFDNCYTIEIVFDYELFGYDVENNVPDIYKMKEIETIEETEKILDQLLHELYTNV